MLGELTVCMHAYNSLLLQVVVRQSEPLTLSDCSVCSTEGADMLGDGENCEGQDFLQNPELVSYFRTIKYVMMGKRCFVNLHTITADELQYRRMW